ncbi:MAG: hypothetical protein AB7F36_12810, partial [Reyranellaceae bacterium]
AELLQASLPLRALALAGLVAGGGAVYGALVLLLKAGSIAGLRASLRRQPGVKPEPGAGEDAGGR